MAKHKIDPKLDDRFLAAVDLIGRTGAEQFQIRFCEEEKPVVWIAGGKWGEIWQFGASVNPLSAVFDLCDTAIDGGTCRYCARTTGFSPDHTEMPLDALICWYQYDPELKTFRRGCE